MTMERARVKTSSLVRAGSILLLSGALGFAPRAADAQLQFGPQISAGTDSSLGLGARVLFAPRTGSRVIDGVLEANRFFQGDVDSWVDLSVNLRLSLPLAEEFGTRIGTGLNVAIISQDVVGGPSTSTDTSFGLNLLAAFEYPREGVLGGRAIPFAETRVVIGGAEQFVFTVGATIGSRGDP
jgi:hypothetical protein